MARGKRIPQAQRLGLMVEIARLDCTTDLTQRQIADYLGSADRGNKRITMSTMEVSRLLKEARREGIIQYLFCPPKAHRTRDALLKRFHCLRDAIVVVAGSDYLFQQRMLAHAAAKYFDHLVAGQQPIKVGISGGNTIYEVVEALPSTPRSIDIYPTALIARGPNLPDHMDQMIIIGELWKKSGRNQGMAHYATLPPFDSGSSLTEVRDWHQGFRKLEKVEAVWQGMCSVDLVLVSVGSFEERYREKRGRSMLDLLGEMNIDSAWINEREVVGDISHSLFDSAGRPIPEGDMFLTLGCKRISELAKKGNPSVVMVAGMFKERALKAALRGGLCNVLITDEGTANSLLEQ